MSKPMHLKCPNCKQYIRGPVKTTRMECDGIMRKRLCEKCGIMIVTMEEIVETYEKRSRC